VTIVLKGPIKYYSIYIYKYVTSKDYSSDSGSESDSDSEESDSNEDTSSASSSASATSSRSVSPTEKKIISEEVGTLVGSALEDGMISANRSAAASRASVNVDIQVNNF